MNISNNNNTTTADSNISTGMSTSDYCKDGVSTPSDSICEVASKSNNTLEVNDKLQNMSMATDNIPVCANCGKEGSDVNNICNKCKQVTYCNAACKKKHRHKHKKQCERRVAELHDKKIFKQPPPQLGDCPICFLQMPLLNTGWRYYTCCGKRICSGCVHAPLYDNQGNKVKQEKCPFCRAPYPVKDENMKRIMKRVEMNDPITIFNTGCDYQYGRNGYPQDYTKALELWHRSAELGYAEAYSCIGYAYDFGEGVEVDKKKAKHYWELAAMGGDVEARYNLGNMERDAGNFNRAVKHHMIAAGSGDNDSLKIIQEFYSEGDATKEDYMKALQLYQEYLGEIKSIQRDEAAAFSERYRYY